MIKTVVIGKSLIKLVDLKSCCNIAVEGERKEIERQITKLYNTIQ